MPNFNNIESPIALISYGRSGSSLLSKIFELHPDFSVVGETGNFTASLWAAYEFSSGQMAPCIVDGRWIPDDERAGRMARASFLSCFPDDKKQWFHKPIGVPTVISSKLSEEQGDEEQWNEAATWYWNVINSTFPKARFFTVLRHPFDVILSAKSYWGFDEASIWKNYGIMSYLLSHPLSPVEYAISYEDLVLDSVSTVKSLFEYLEVPFYEESMNAFSVVHAASTGRECISTDLVTRKHEWSKLDNSKTNPRYVDLALRLFDKYKKPITLPVDAYNSICQEFNDKSVKNITGHLFDENSVDQIISKKNEIIELINSTNSRNALKREREIFEIFNEDQKWMSELEKARQWLTLENDRLKAFVEQLQKGTAWLSAERDAWKQIATRREQSLAALTSGLAASDALLIKIRNHWKRFMSFLSSTRFS